jgi:hypothetical protein
MRRPNYLWPAVASIALLAGCSDQATAPKVVSMPPGAPKLDVIVDHMAVDSTSADFTVTPSGGVFVIGPHAIKFPANSICDPASSSYGPDQWDVPCEPLAEAIQIHAEVRNQDGYAWVDFTPSLRFVPTDNPDQYVWILMKSQDAFNATDVSPFGIFWSQALGQPGIDEAATDPSQVTYLWREGGIVFRRIKHFTGYYVHDRLDLGVILDAEVTPVDF